MKLPYAIIYSVEQDSIFVSPWRTPGDARDTG
jgi:hypothetical protein